MLSLHMLSFSSSSSALLPYPLVLLLFVFFLLLPALSLLLLFILPLLLLPPSSLLLSFPLLLLLLLLPPLLNIFYLNLSCEYSFCFALLNFTCLRVAIRLSMFLLIKLLYKHIIMNCTTQTRRSDPVHGPGGCDHRVPG